MKTFLKKYWWLVLPLPLIVLYWLYKSGQQSPQVNPGTVAASQAESGNPASADNAPQPGSSHAAAPGVRNN